MALKKSAEYAIWALLLVILASVLLGQALGQPILLAYVETGSMAPTMEPGDGFIAVPTAVAGPIGEGDVITFNAENLHGGGLVTHRVVGRTDNGYITQGDANPFTDQESTDNEPPVQREQIVAVALQLNGNLVVLPQIGVLVTGTSDVMSDLQRSLAGLVGSRALLGSQGFAYLLFALGAGAYFVSFLLERDNQGKIQRSRGRDRGDRFDPRLVIGALTLLLIGMVTASMVLTGGTQQFDVVSADTDAPGPRVIQAGTSENTTYTIPSNGIIPAVVFLEGSSDGVRVQPREVYVPSNGEVTATVTLTAPEETGFYQRFVVEHRYLAVLPRGMIRELYEIHPWLPIIVIDAIVGVGFFAGGTALLGLEPKRDRSRTVDRAWTARLRQWFR